MAFYRCNINGFQKHSTGGLDAPVREASSPDATARYRRVARRVLVGRSTGAGCSALTRRPAPASRPACRADRVRTAAAVAVLIEVARDSRPSRARAMPEEVAGMRAAATGPLARLLAECACRVRALRERYRTIAADTPKARATTLLRQWLSPQQRAQFDAEGYFDVVGCATAESDIASTMVRV